MSLTAAEQAWRRTRQNAGQLSFLLLRTAEALERSAVLADEQAERLNRAGKDDAAAEERRVAVRAREAAARARAHSVEYRTRAAAGAR